MDHALAQPAHPPPALPLWQPCRARVRSAPPGGWSSSAHNVYARRPLPHGQHRPASRRSRNTAASQPGAMSACHGRRASATPGWRGPLHPAATPSGRRSMTSHSATEGRDLRPLGGLWPFQGAVGSRGVGRRARRTRYRSLARRLPPMAHHCSTSWLSRPDTKGLTAPLRACVRPGRSMRLSCHHVLTSASQLSDLWLSLCLCPLVYACSGHDIINASKTIHRQRRKSWLSTPTNIFRKRFATPKAKAGS